MPRDIYVTQSIETHAFEVSHRGYVDPTRLYSDTFKSPCEMYLTVKQGMGELMVMDSGELGGVLFQDLDLDQAVTAFKALQWAVAAQQTMVQEESGTMKALRALGTNIGPR